MVWRTNKRRQRSPATGADDTFRATLSHISSESVSVWRSAAAQAGWLDAFLENEFFDNSHRGRCVPIVIRMDVDYNQLLLRLTGRRSCPTCGRIYNVHFQPPRVANTCDVDGSQLVTRNDDREDVIRERLTAYELQTRPVVEYYEQKGRLVPVNADLAVDEVSEQVFREIESHSTAAAGRS